MAESSPANGGGASLGAKRRVYFTFALGEAEGSRQGLERFWGGGLSGGMPGIEGGQLFLWTRAAPGRLTFVIQPASRNLRRGKPGGFLPHLLPRPKTLAGDNRREAWRAPR